MILIFNQLLNKLPRTHERQIIWQKHIIVVMSHNN